MRTSPKFALLAIVAVLAACTTPAASSAPSAASVAPSVEPSAPAESASPSADACAKDSLAVVAPGKLTLGTDNPAYPPYFAENADGSKTAPWELGDPTNGKGFEAAVGYAIAEKLGFSAEEVVWTVVPFANAFAPGPKDFDFDLNQVSFKPERAETADLTDGYYFGNQSLVVLKTSPLATATSIAALKDSIFGAQVGTTSYDAIAEVIAPTKEAAGVRLERRGYPGARPGLDRRRDRRPADRRLHHERPGRGLDHRRSVRRWHARALQRGPGQGQPAHGMRERRDRGAHRRTGPWTSSRASSCRSRTACRSSSRSRRGSTR